MSKNEKIFLQLEGNADDLLLVSKDHSTKCTRLIKLDPTSRKEDEETIDISITSTNDYGSHPVFDKLQGKKIRITVEIL